MISFLSILDHFDPTVQRTVTNFYLIYFRFWDRTDTIVYRLRNYRPAYELCFLMRRYDVQNVSDKSHVFFSSLSRSLSPIAQKQKINQVFSSVFDTDEWQW